MRPLKLTRTCTNCKECKHVNYFPRYYTNITVANYSNVCILCTARPGFPEYETTTKFRIKSDYEFTTIKLDNEQLNIGRSLNNELFVKLIQNDFGFIIERNNYE